MRALFVLVLFAACAADDDQPDPGGAAGGGAGGSADGGGAPGGWGGEPRRVDVAGFTFEIATVAYFRTEAGDSYGVIADLPGGCEPLRPVATGAMPDLTMLVIGGEGELPFTCELPRVVVPPGCSGASFRRFMGGEEEELDALVGFVTFGPAEDGGVRLSMDLEFPSVEVDWDCRDEERPSPCTCTPEVGEPFECLDDSGWGEIHCCQAGVPWVPLRMQIDATDCGVLVEPGG